MKTQRRTLIKNLFASAIGVTGLGFTSGVKINFSEDFSAVLSRIGSTPTTLVVNTLQMIETNTTIPSTLSIRIEAGGGFVIKSGYTLTIEGSLTAGFMAIFSGNGSVVFGKNSIREAYPQWWGAAGDGVTEDSSSFQKALKAIGLSGGGTLFIPMGVFVIRDLRPSDNTRIILHPNAILLAHPSIALATPVVYLKGVSNVIIEGGLIDGNRNNLVISGGEARMCLRISDACQNITIRDMLFKKAYGDGVYIREANNILLNNIICDNNYRNGLSITDNCSNIRILYSVFKNSKGTSPQAGIDIEPNANTFALDNILVDNCEIYGNSLNGISLSNFGVEIQKNLKILNCYIHDNLSSGIGGLNNTELSIYNCTIKNNQYGGIRLQGDQRRIKILNCDLIGNAHQCQLYISPRATNDCPYGVDDIEIIGGCYMNSAAKFDGIYIYFVAGRVTKNIKIIGVTASDFQAIPTQRYGITLMPTSGDVFMTNCITENNVTAPVLVNNFVQRK